MPAPVRMSADTRRLSLLAAAIALLSLPALLANGVVARAAALNVLAQRPDPFVIPEHAGLLYVAVPIVAVSACVLFLAPGLFLALALGRGDDIGEWVVSGLAISIVIVSIVAGVAQAAGLPVRGAGFAWLVALLTVVAAALVARRLRAGRRVAWPLADEAAWPFACAALVVPWLLLAALAPKFLWENFNGDGAHAFESTRVLLVRSVPFWPKSAGPVAVFPGMTSLLFAYPASWFQRLFGSIEVAERLPVILYLQALVGALFALARVGRKAVRLPAEPWLLWLGSTAFLVSMAFSATYNQYMADIALPATQDTLLVVCFLGFVLAFLRGEVAWMALFGALTYVSLPSGLELMVFWMAAVWFVMSPRPARTLRVAGAILLICIVVAALIPRLLAAAGLPGPGEEYGLAGIFRYFAWLQLTDVRRLAYVVIPCGIAPAFALLFWRRQDSVARALTLVTIAYFLFFFVQAHISLHHFVPAMLLPLGVFWRLTPESATGVRRWQVFAAVSGVLAIALALPPRATIDTSGRKIGSTIAIRLDDYARSEPATFKHSSLLAQAFPLDWDAVVPAEYGGSPLVWNHYARHVTSGAEAQAPGVNYLIQPIADAAPVGWRRIDDDSVAALFIRNDSVWQADLALRPPTPAGAHLLNVPRSILFRSIKHDGHPHIIDVTATLERLGVNMTSILARLGVKR
jgi:hypothetical protein